jgi:hypothetical protein
LKGYQISYYILHNIVLIGLECHDLSIDFWEFFYCLVCVCQVKRMFLGVQAIKRNTEHFLGDVWWYIFPMYFRFDYLYKMLCYLKCQRALPIINTNRSHKMSWYLLEVYNILAISWYLYCCQFKLDTFIKILFIIYLFIYLFLFLVFVCFVYNRLTYNIFWRLIKVLFINWVANCLSFL